MRLARLGTAAGLASSALWRRARGAWPSKQHGAHTARTPISLEQRRARVLLGGAALFALIVLVSSFPLAALFSQRHQLSSAASELSRLAADDQSLSRQVAQLSDPATVKGIARRDFGLVPKGQRAYDVLPAASSGGRTNTAPSALNGPPVVPGSARSQSLLGLDPSAPSPSALRAPAPAVGPVPAGGYWTRVARTLEFWR